MNDGSARDVSATTRANWHFTPELPIRLAPYWDRPARWGVILRYIVNGWSPLGSRFYLLLIALGIWFFTSPALERTASLQFDWIFQIWIRNVILITVVAGGLHLYLYTFRGQGDEWRYDKRAYPAKGKAFLFGNQLWDNVFWTLGSGVAVQTAYEVFFMWAYANGIATLITLEENPVLFIVLILLIPYWNAVHFEVQHRLLHWPPLFRWVHFRHHRNVNLAPWSGLTQHPVEHVVDQSDCMIFLFIPSHPVHVIFQLMYHGVNGPVTHTGYDGIRLSKTRRFEIGDFFHHLHHRYFDCNYGGYDTPWDRLFGSFHDGTEEGDRLIQARRKAMKAKRQQVAATEG